MTSRRDFAEPLPNTPTAGQSSRMASAINPRGSTSSVSHEPVSSPCPAPRQQARESVPNTSSPDMPYPIPGAAHLRRHHRTTSSYSQPLQAMNRVGSHTIDRIGSVLDFSSLRSSQSNSAALQTFNDSQRKLVAAMIGNLAEIEIRLGMRPLSAAQAQVRLEKLHQDILEGSFESDVDLAMTLTQEICSSVIRLEEVCCVLRQCNNLTPLCECQYLHGRGTIGPLYTVRDNVSGRTIQSFVDLCAEGKKDEPSKIRAVYDGLGDFFKKTLGSYDPRKPRCQSRAGFLAAWGTMIVQPAYLNNLDAELSRIQQEGFLARERGEHLGKPSLGKRLTNFFGSGYRKGADQFGKSF